MDPYKEMMAVLGKLDDAKIPYALCGGLALMIYGYPRHTKDIDLLVSGADVAAIKNTVKLLGFTHEAIPMEFEKGTKNETRLHRITKLEGRDHLILDLLEIEPGFDEVWKTRRRLETDDGWITAVSREGLIAMKRRAGRPQDLVDITKLEEGADDAT